MIRLRRTLCLFALLSTLALPSFAVPASGASENRLSDLLRSVAQWLTAIATFGEEIDGRCGLDPWGCPSGE